MAKLQKKRPVLTIPRSPLEVVMELGSFLGIFAVFLLLARTWPDLPDLVPQHFGFAGEPDAWGSKRTLLFLPAVGIGLYLLLTIVSRFPHTFNYLVTITEENAWELYRLARLLMGWLKLEIIWIFTFLQYKTVMVAFLLFLPFQEDGLEQYNRVNAGLMRMQQTGSQITCFNFATMVADLKQIGLVSVNI